MVQTPFAPNLPEQESDIDRDYKVRLDRIEQLEQQAEWQRIRDNNPDAIAARENLNSSPKDSDDMSRDSDALGSIDDSRDLQDQEQNPGYENKFTGQDGPKQKKGAFGQIKGLLSGKKGPLGVIGALFGIGGIGLLLLLPMLLSLKMFGLLANMTEAASSIPSYAVEQRTEYLITRTFATWLIRKGAGDSLTDADTAAVFCNGGSIGCSLKWTYINDYFDKMYDLSNWADATDGDGNRIRSVTVTPKGRDNLGAKARSWTMNVHANLGPDRVTFQMAEINSNAEMKGHIKDHVKQRMYTKSIISRYIARKALMKRYGVTNFRGFEQPLNSLAEKKSAFKAAMIKNTIGKISPNAGKYLACFSGGSDCDTLKDLYRAEINDLPHDPNVETAEQYERRVKRNEALRKVTGDVIDSTPVDEVITKHISKQLVTKLGGAVAIAGVIDVVMGAVGGIDDGAIETVMHNIRATAAVGYAMGDESGLAPNIEKYRAGEGIDPDVMTIMAEQLENVEASPVFQAETGLLGASASAGGFERTCDKDGEQVQVVLTNSYVCPERQVLPNVTEFMNNPHMSLLADAAAIWNNTAGQIFDFVGGISDFVMEKMGVNALIQNAFGDDFERFAGWVLGLFIDIPSMGDEATGDQNYDTLSAGVWITQNGMMENGVEAGDLVGGGGTLLTNEEIAVIQKDYRNQELEQFNSHSYLARMFDTELSNSFASRLLASLPLATFTSPAGLLSLPSTAMANIPNAFSPAAKADAGPLNPHNIPLYGYPAGHSALTADPTIYTTEFCKTSAEEREESYTLNRDLYPIKVYTKADPCALERLAIGNILHSMGVKDDPNSFKELDVGLNCGPSGSSRGSVGSKMPESQFKQEMESYGLLDDIDESDSPTGYKALLEKLKTDPNAGWAAQQMLNGEKNFKSKGGEIKEYLTSTWLWFETGSFDAGGWPDPYEYNCMSNTRFSIELPCNIGGGPDKVQVAGYQAWDVRHRMREIYKMFYEENELESVLQSVVSNSSKAAVEEWKYASDAASRIQGATFSDLYEESGVGYPQFNDPKAQYINFMLGKDPNMAAALNSFAVSDGDVVTMIKNCQTLGWSNNDYYCNPKLRPVVANMMMALYMFDGLGPAAGAANCLAGSAGRALGKGLASIVEGNTTPENNFKAEWGNGLYIYGQNYGLNGSAHTGIDIGGERGAAVFTPVSGTVRCARTDNVECWAFNSYKLRPDNPLSCPDFGPQNVQGDGLIEITLDNGEVLILGHVLESKVTVGQRVEAGQQVGTVGCMNGHHIHVEYRVPNPDMNSGFEIVDPSKYL